MNVQLELWHLITLLVLFLGSVWAFGKTLMDQFEKRLKERFEGIETARKEGSDRWEREFEDIERRIDSIAERLPHEYVRREDWIRFSATTDAKLDALHRKIDVMTEKMYARS